MFLKKLMCLPLTVLLLATTTFPSNPPSQASIAGVWDFELEVTQMVYPDGFIKKERHFFEWVVRLRQNGNQLTGDLIGGRGARGESVCADAAIEGSIRGRRIEFTVTYQGYCCKDEQLNFIGELGDDNKSLTGKLEPADVPRSNCRAAYADIKASKRENRR